MSWSDFSSLTCVIKAVYTSYISRTTDSDDMVNAARYAVAASHSDGGLDATASAHRHPGRRSCFDRDALKHCGVTHHPQDQAAVYTKLRSDNIIVADTTPALMHSPWLTNAWH